MAAQSIFLKDPSAVLDYQIDWSAWLPVGDTISATAWTAATGITIASNVFTTTSATVWLSGGTSSVRYNLTCHITTAAGRQDERSILVFVVER